MNPREPKNFPSGRCNLYIGGAGVDGYVNLDLLSMPGVDVVADAGELPFPTGLFQRVKCDAVLEHVSDAQRVTREIKRVMAPGGYAHLMTPFFATRSMSIRRISGASPWMG
jgi:SAM-dependent methyltransferase